MAVVGAVQRAPVVSFAYILWRLLLHSLRLSELVGVLATAVACRAFFQLWLHSADQRRQYQHEGSVVWWERVVASSLRGAYFP